MNYADFCREIEMEKAAAFRNAVESNKGSIKIKKEKKLSENLSRIFDATIELANEKGFQAMSMRDLSSKASLSLGALYSYFSSKDELLEMIQGYSLAMVSVILTDSIKKEPDGSKKLERAIRTHVYITEYMQPWFYFSYMEAKNMDRAAQKRAIEGELFTEKIFSDIIESSASGKKPGDRDPVMTASLIKAMLQDWYLKRWKYRKRKIGPDQFADFLISFVRSSI